MWSRIRPPHVYLTKLTPTGTPPHHHHPPTYPPSPPPPHTHTPQPKHNLQLHGITSATGLIASYQLSAVPFRITADCRIPIASRVADDVGNPARTNPGPRFHALSNGLAFSNLSPTTGSPRNRDVVFIHGACFVSCKLARAEAA